MNIVLISTYELGHQPFGLASPAAWLRREGHEVFCLDTSQQALKDFESTLAEGSARTYWVWLTGRGGGCRRPQRPALPC